MVVVVVVAVVVVVTAVVVEEEKVNVVVVVTVAVGVVVVVVVAMGDLGGGGGMGREGGAGGGDGAGRGANLRGECAFPKGEEYEIKKHLNQHVLSFAVGLTYAQYCMRSRGASAGQIAMAVKDAAGLEDLGQLLHTLKRCFLKVCKDGGEQAVTNNVLGLVRCVLLLADIPRLLRLCMNDSGLRMRRTVEVPPERFTLERLLDLPDGIGRCLDHAMRILASLAKPIEPAHPLSQPSLKTVQGSFDGGQSGEADAARSSPSLGAAAATVAQSPVTAATLVYVKAEGAMAEGPTVALAIADTVTGAVDDLAQELENTCLDPSPLDNCRITAYHLRPSVTESSLSLSCTSSQHSPSLAWLFSLSFFHFILAD